jgi:hypothetical protein
MTEPTPPTPVKEPQDPTKVVRPTDDEVTAVAVAMDVDNKLNWNTKDHADLVAIGIAKERALFALLAFRAASNAAGFVAAVKSAGEKAAADKKAADDAKAAADKAAAAAKASGSLPPVVAKASVPMPPPKPELDVPGSLHLGMRPATTPTIEAPVNVVAPAH